MELADIAKKLKSLGFLALVLCNTHCSSIWPKYTQPNVHPESKWHSTDPKTQISHLKLSEMAWWKHFNDPQLNALIKKALIKNNDLHVAFGNILLAKAALQQARLQWLPSLGIGASGFTGRLNSLNFKPSNGASLYDTYGQHDWVYDGYTAGFIPTYALNLLSQIKQIEISKLDLAKRIELAHATRLTIIGQMSASYFTLLGLKKQLMLHRKMLSDLRQLRHYGLIQQKNGALSDMEIAGIEQDVALVQKEIPMIKHSITAAENSIHTLVNENPGPVKVYKSFDDINANGVIPIYVPADAVKTRPDILAAEYQLKIYNATIAQATSQFFPTLDLAGYLGPFELTVYRGFHLYTDFILGQIGFAEPLIAFSTIYSDIKKAQTAKYGAYYNYLGTVRHAFEQIDDAISKHHRVNQSYQLQLVAFEKSQKQYQLGNIRYHQGAIAYSDTLLNKFNRDMQEAVLNQQKQTQMLSIVDLYLQLGGGAKVGNKCQQKNASTCQPHKKKKGIQGLLSSIDLW